MKSLDEVIANVDKWRENARDCDNCVCHPDSCMYQCDLVDALHYLKQYKADLDKKCSNCKNWHGHKNYDRNDPCREEYYCEYETWTYPEDSCSKWEEML